MGKLVYWMNASIDGYIENSDGRLDFMEPPEDFHEAANDLMRRTAALLFGRRLYEAMERPWTVDFDKENASPVEQEFARLYRERPRYVFSDTLRTAPDGVTIVRREDAASVVTRLKQEFDGPIQVGGPDLAASLLHLIDEFALFTFPVVIGSGRPYLPVGEPLRLQPVEHRVLASGVTYTRHVRA